MVLVPEMHASTTQYRRFFYVVPQYDGTHARTPVLMLAEAPFRKRGENLSKQLHSHCHYNRLTVIATSQQDTVWKAKKGSTTRENGPSTVYSTTGCVPVPRSPFLRAYTYLCRSILAPRSNQIQISERLQRTQYF